MRHAPWPRMPSGPYVLSPCTQASSVCYPMWVSETGGECLCVRSSSRISLPFFKQRSYSAQSDVLENKLGPLLTIVGIDECVWHIVTAHVRHTRPHGI